MRFRDRTEAGERLAKMLTAYANHPDAVVLGLPRGGVPVAFVVARRLHLPLDVMIVRKLGVPGQEELAMGAVAAGGARVLNDEVIQTWRIPQAVVEAATVREQREIVRREHLYRKNRPLPELRGRTVILVDDGIATGATMRAAIVVARAHQPARVVVAIPVAAAETCNALQAEVDELVCVFASEAFFGVGLWYDQFPQITDDAVCAFLERAWKSERRQRQRSYTAT